MAGRLEGRVALVTGASRGLGASAAVALAKEGAHIIATARTEGGLSELDDAIKEMIKTPHPVLFDCRVANLANCFPMIPSGKAHNEMILGEEVADEDVGSVIDAKGKMLV